MSAFIPVPGVAQAVEHGTVAGNPWAAVLHFSKGAGPWSSVDIQTLANTVHTAWSTNLKTYQASNVVNLRCDTIDLTNSTPFLGSSVGASVPGSGATVALTPAACYLVNFHIASRYRGGHPRLYLAAPYLGETTADGENVQTGVIGALNTSMVAFISAIVTAIPGTTHCVPRYSYTYTDVPGKHKYTKVRSGLVGVFTVASYDTHSKVASQRRRLQT